MQGKIFRVWNFYRDLIFTRSWHRVLLASDVWTLTRAESVMRCRSLQFSAVLSVRARARYLFFDCVETALQLDSHRVALGGFQSWVGQRVISSASWHIERGLVFQFLAHMEFVIFREGRRLNIVVTSTRGLFVILDTLTLVSSKAKNWSFAFGHFMFRLVLNFSSNTLCSKFGFWTLLLSTKTPIWRCLQRPCTLAVVILAWPRNKLVLFILEFVMVHWRHSKRNTFFADVILGLIRAWRWSLKFSGFSHFFSLCWSSKAVLWSISLSNEVLWRIITRARYIFGLFCVCQINSISST